MNTKVFVKKAWDFFTTWGLGFILVAIVIWGMETISSGGKHRLYLIQVNPQSLKNKNENERRTWSTVCIDNAGKGLLSGQRSSSELPEACVKAAFALYPDKDWAAEAEANRKALDRF